MLNKSLLMRRAWSLLRQSMAPYSRPAFAAHLRQAWEEARNAPVTDWAVLQRYLVVTRGTHRLEVIRKLESALTVARGRAAQYRRAGAPTSWTAAKYRSTDLMRVANLEVIFATEKSAAGLAHRYSAKRAGEALILKRDGAVLGRLSTAAGTFSLTAPDAALVQRVRFDGADTLQAALAKVRAADEALRAAPCGLIPNTNRRNPQCRFLSGASTRT